MATQSELAAFLGISDRRVRQLQGEGVLPVAGRGDLDLRACTLAYLDHLRELAAGRRSDGGEFDLIAERARLAKEQADKYAMENAVRRRELVNIRDVAEIVGEEYAEVRNGLLELPGRLAQPLAYETDPAKISGILKDTISEILTALTVDENPEKVAA